MHLINTIFFLAATLQCVLADWQYLSRPDLSPPRLNITIPAKPATENGYIFVSPYQGSSGGAGPLQPGSYIFRDDGDLVWSGFVYLSGILGHFEPTVINGKSVLKSVQSFVASLHGRTYGNQAILGNDYETLKVLRAGSHKFAGIHELEVVDGGRSVLLETPTVVPFDLGEFGAEPGQEWILNNGFQEIDIETGEVLFEWNSLDHVDPNIYPLKTTGHFNAYDSDDAWDYFHLNSAAKYSDGNYLISARHCSAIFKINGTSGEVIWQLGGPHGSDFEIPSNLQFAFQHDARIRYVSEDGLIEHISFFDNSAASPEKQGQKTDKSSRARYVELNRTSGTAREIQIFWSPDGLLANSQGNAQFLPEGNVFVNWGQAGAITEFAEDGEVLFHAYLDSYPNKLVQSYRGFRKPWTGYSREEIAVLALEDSSGEVAIYVSWNGDTETDVWRFYLVNEKTGLEHKYLGEKKRASFETTFHVSLDLSAGGPLDQVFITAVAHNREGKVLGKSRATGLSDKTPYLSHLG